MAFCLSAVCGLSACASLTRDTTEILGIQSEPSGAYVRASTGWDCVTPCEVKVKRRSHFALDIEMPGYKTARVLVNAEIDGAGQAGMAGNILIGGLIGAMVDGSSGAMYSHLENPVVVVLVPDEDSSGLK